MDFDDPGLAACQQLGEPACAVAPHGIHHHGQPGVLEGLQVDQCLDVFNVGGGGIEHLHRAIGQRVFERHT